MVNNKLSILVIDDEASLKDVYTNFLAKIDASVDFFDHPQKAWLAIDKEEYDLIITDLKMPLISGDEFISIVRSSKLNAHTPIILCSGHINKLVMTEVSRESKIYFLSKPFDSSSLLDLAKKAIGVKQSTSTSSQDLNQKWIQSFSANLSNYCGDKISNSPVEEFELWNFETVGITFQISKDNDNLNITLLMKLNTFLKIAGKIQGTQYKEIEPETLHVWQDLLNNTIHLNGRVTFSKLISQEFLSVPNQKATFLKITTPLGEILTYLN